MPVRTAPASARPRGGWPTPAEDEHPQDRGRPDEPDPAPQNGSSRGSRRTATMWNPPGGRRPRTRGRSGDRAAGSSTDDRHGVGGSLRLTRAGGPMSREIDWHVDKAADITASAVRGDGVERGASPRPTWGTCSARCTTRSARPRTRCRRRIRSRGSEAVRVEPIRAAVLAWYRPRRRAYAWRRCRRSRTGRSSPR